VSGNNTPLVLLHGLLGDSGDWQPVIDRLPGHRCIALDLPGHGSHSTLTVDGFEQSHQWLVAKLASRNIERYLLAGYSLGGRLALYHASREPAGLQGLLLENCHPGLPASERAARIQHDEQWAQRFEQEPLASVLDDWYRQGVFADLDDAARARQIARRLAAGHLGEWQAGSQIPSAGLPAGESTSQNQPLGAGGRPQPARPSARNLCPTPRGVGQPTRRDES